MASLLSTLVLLLAANISGALAQAAKPPTSFSGYPAVGSVVKDWKYMGCATEIPGRALTGLSYSDDKMTIDSCQAFCTKNGYYLSGVEYGRECYCGRFLAPPAGYIYNKDCNMPCKGDPKQMCGGYARVSIFNNTNYRGPAAPKTVPGTSWGYVSCFMEPQYGRALTKLVKADDKMTVPMCVSACQGEGFAFAGLEYGRECWCGATKSDDLEDASDPQCAMQCDMQCGGDSNTICGGRGAIGIYRNNNNAAPKKPKRAAVAAAAAARGGRPVVGVSGSGSQRQQKKKDRRDHHEDHDHGRDDYRNYGHGPVKVDVDVGARKGRFVKVVRRSPDGKRQVEREEKRRTSL